MDYTKVKGIHVYLELRSTRLFVGTLGKTKGGYSFSYHSAYLDHKKAIPLGPEFPLTKLHFESIKIFPSFLDRIPSKDNPAYKSYCVPFKISPNESNIFVLLATIGSKGPSSFIFYPDWSDAFDRHMLKRFRKSLKLTTREFASRFGFSQSSIVRIENGSATGKETFRLLEIFYQFPKTQNYYVHQSASFLPKDLKAFRLALGLSLKNFSHAFNVAASTIMRIEKGQKVESRVIGFLSIMRKFPEVAHDYIEKYAGFLHSKTRYSVLTFLKNHPNPPSA